VAEPLEPIAAFNLGSDGPSGVGPVRIDFAPGGVMYVQDMARPSGIGTWVRDHSPDLAVAAFLIAMVVGALVMVRAVRRPRARGRVYCRRCNYELTEPLVRLETGRRVVVDDAASRCPECGSELGAVRPVVGRGRRRRLVAPLLIAGAVMVVCLVVGYSSLEAYPGGPVMPGRARPWPGAWVLKVAPRLALQRREQWPRWVQRITPVDLATGRVGATLVELPSDWMLEAKLSADGRMFAAAWPSAPHAPATVFGLIDAASGRVRTLDLSGSVVQVVPVGFSADSRRVYVQVQPETTGDDAETALHEIDVETMTDRVVTTEREPYLRLSGGAALKAAPTQIFLLPRDGVGEKAAGDDWILVKLRSMWSMSTTKVAEPPTMTVVVMRKGDRREFKVDLPSPDFYTPRLSTDGARLIVPTQDSASGSAKATHVELEIRTGEVTTRPAPSVGATTSEDGRFEFQTQTSQSVVARRTNGSGPGVALRVPRKDQSNYGEYGLPMFSSDGRYVAKVVMEPKSPPAAPGGVVDWKGIVYVWDLGPRWWETPGGGEAAK
jgi:hypothetical protein